MDLGGETDGEGWRQSCVVESLPGLDEAKAKASWGAGEQKACIYFFVSET